ncbi:MAG TPA: LapA family protein [Mesorhizobium sp.]|jgi:uncharacterized integral membrane protein|nr:LapA family protein [Mesorhizobium sp.]
MLSRLLWVLVFAPLGVVLIALAVANRRPAPFTLDPFNPGNPPLTAELPLFVWLFGALALGLVVGALVTWAKQGRYRRLAREREAQIARLKEEARLKPPPLVVAPSAMPPAAGPAVSVPALAKPAA